MAIARNISTFILLSQCVTAINYIERCMYFMYDNCDTVVSENKTIE